ncbi:MAG: HAMP domain-containing protein [Myxococcota bacterium]|jgi:HAMP domain-containing protein
MAMPPYLRRELDEVARELDLLVFQLERPASRDLQSEREHLRRELERLGQQLEEALRALS